MHDACAWALLAEAESPVYTALDLNSICCVSMCFPADCHALYAAEERPVVPAVGQVSIAL
jgi:hypothetical protein